MTDAIVKVPPDSLNGKAVYMIKVTRDIAGNPVDIYVPTEYLADMPTYVATVAASAVGANKNHISLVNKTGSTKTVRIFNIYATPSLSAAVNGSTITLEVHGILGSNPTAGTVITIRQHDTDDDPLPVEIEARANPTSTPLADWILSSGTVVTEETNSRDSQSHIFQKNGNVSALILRANQGILVRQTGFASVGNLNIHIVFGVD